MGTSSSKAIAQELKINDEDWQYLTLQHNQQIVRHRWKDLEGEVEVIASDPRYSIQDEMEIYLYRKEQDRTLVEVYCAEYLKSSEATMCGNQQNIKVIYQRMPHRLRDLQSLTLPQAIYVLSECLRGFRECYDKVGSFQLNDRMVGLNKEGSVKVWLNENFAANHPEAERPLLQITASSAHKSSASKEESAFVKNIVEMVRGKLEERRFGVQLERMLKQASGFYETYSVIEKYCKEKNVWVPDRIVLGASRRKENTAESRAFEEQAPAESGHAHNQPKSRYVTYPFVNYGSSTPTKQNASQLQQQALSSPYTPYRYIQPIDLSDYRPSPVTYRPI